MVLLFLFPAIIFALGLNGCAEAGSGGSSSGGDDGASTDDLTGTWMATETMTDSSVAPDPDRSILLEFSGNNYCALFFENYAGLPE